jgi:hypothetical protein
MKFPILQEAVLGCRGSILEVIPDLRVQAAIAIA